MDTQSGGRPLRELELEWSQTLASLVDPEEFPEVSSVLATEAFGPGSGDPDGDPDFDFGLRCILEGVARLAERQATE